MSSFVPKVFLVLLCLAPSLPAYSESAFQNVVIAGPPVSSHTGELIQGAITRACLRSFEMATEKCQERGGEPVPGPEVPKLTYEWVRTWQGIERFEWVCQWSVGCVFEIT